MAYVDFDELELDEYNIHFWRGDPFTGVAVERFSNGGLRCSMPFENGMANGITKEWFESNEIKSETLYVKGAKQGASKEWYETGALKKESIFECGICISAKTWEPEGSLKSEFKLAADDPLYSTIAILRAAATKASH